MKIKEITIKVRNDCVSGEIYCEDTYENTVVEFINDGDGWHQWGAGTDILKMTVGILDSIFNINSDLINDLKSYID